MKKTYVFLAIVSALLTLPNLSAYADDYPAPQGFDMQVKANTAVLTWEVPEAEGLTGYRFYVDGELKKYSIYNSKYYYAANLTPEDTTFTIYGFDIGSHTVSMTAVYGDNESEQTEEKSISVSYVFYEERIYGWDAASPGKDMDFGKCNVNQTIDITDLRLYPGSNDISMFGCSVTDRDHFAVQIGDAETDGNGKTYYPVTITAKTGETEGEFTATARVGSMVGYVFDINLSLTVLDTDCPTLEKFRETQSQLSYYETANYTGKARINYADGDDLWVSDGTGYVNVQCLPGLVDYLGLTGKLTPGNFVRFTARPGLRGEVKSPYCKATNIELVDGDWEYPECDLLTDGFTTDDYGKYIRIQGVKFDNEEVYTPLFPNEDGFKPRYIEFTDAQDNRYICYPPDVQNPYVWGLSDELKTAEDLEIVGLAIGDSKNNGFPEPMIIPLSIRPATPATTIADGTYQVSATNVATGESQTWSATVTRDEADAYKYTIANLCGVDGTVVAQVANDGDSLVVYTGQALGEGLWLATYNDASAAALPKGTVLPIKVGEDMLTIAAAFGVQGNESSVWAKDATMQQGEETVAFTLCSETPWGAWQEKASGSNIEMGPADLNTVATSDTYRLFLGSYAAEDFSFSFEDAETFGVELGEVANDGENNYRDVTFSANTGDTEGVKTSVVSIKAGTQELQYNLQLTVKNLSAGTLQDFKELTAGMTMWDVAKYVGVARVEWREGARVWLSDDSGSILLTGTNTTFNDSIQPGVMVSFTGRCQRAGNPNYYAWTCEEMHVRMDQWPNWTYPQRKYVDEPLTEADYGKVVCIKNLKFKEQEITVPVFGPGEGGYYPIFITFEDEDGNEYVCNPLNVLNRYVWGLDPNSSQASNFAQQDQAYKDLCEVLRTEPVEVIGGVIGASKANGAPQPFISPIWIRPMQPVRTLKSGKYEMTAKSYIFEEDTYWDVTVSQDASNPYLYKFTHLVEGNQKRDLDVYGELDDACDSLKISTGQNLDTTSDEDVDYYLATAADFDRTGNTPEQEPAVKGTRINCTVDSDEQMTINDIFDYCCYAYVWADPDAAYYPLRWSHYGIWYAGAVMQLTEDVDDVHEAVAAPTGTQTVYDLQGRQMDAPRKGLNIIRRADGTVVKTWQR